MIGCSGPFSNLIKLKRSIYHKKARYILIPTWGQPASGIYFSRRYGKKCIVKSTNFCTYISSKNEKKVERLLSKNIVIYVILQEYHNPRFIILNVVDLCYNSFSGDILKTKMIYGLEFGTQFYFHMTNCGIGKCCNFSRFTCANIHISQNYKRN